MLHRAATLLAGIGAVALLLGALALPLVTRWSRLEGAWLPSLALYAVLPIAGLASVPMALLDRRLDYRSVAWTELAGQTAFYVVALGVAFTRPTAWAPVMGWWTQQLVVLAGASYAARYLPRLAWDRGAAGEMVRYGTGYSLSICLYQLRRALNPLTTQLSFAAVSAWRLSTAALARVQSDRRRLRRAVEEGMRLQVPAVAPFLLLFAWLGPWLVPALLGEEWRALPEVFPYVAAAFLFGAVFTMQTSALFVMRRNLQVAATHLLQVLLLGGVGWALVPALGVAGWGVGELAALGGFAYLHRVTTRAIGKPAYGRALVLAAGCAAAMFTHQLGAGAVLPLAIALLFVRPWRDLIAALRALREARAEEGAGAAGLEAVR
jgi:PST family polysaccharide transporter